MRARLPDDLPDEVVIAIYLAGGQQETIARQFGTRQPTVSKIKNGGSYRAITDRFGEAGILGATLTTLAIYPEFA